MFFALRSSFNRSMARSLSALMASLTCTCKMRCVPPLRSSPRWMRSCIEASRPAGVKLLGMPKMPNRKKISTAIIMRTFAVRFLVMSNCNLPGLRLLVLRRRQRYDRGACHFQLDVVGRNPQNDGVIFGRQDHSRQSAAGDHIVARLDLLQHLRPLLLFALLRHDEQKVEDCEDRNHHHDRPDAASQSRL